MIEYRTITRRDVIEWQEHHPPVAVGRSETGERIPRSGVQRGAESLSRIGCHQPLEPDTVRAIAAFDGEQVVGRLQIVYSDLLINGRLLRCAVGEDFFVLEEYRDRAVGLSILLKALKLGLPFIESGVSGPMKAILDSWKQFVPVDSSPMFQVALDRIGLVQMAKWDLYEQNVVSGAWTEAWTKALLLFRHWRQRRRLANGGRDRLAVFEPGNTQGFERCLATPRAAVQLPWNTQLLKKALAGGDPNHGAWFVEAVEGGAGPWLVTLYRQERVLGHHSDGTPRTVKEAHLNEIYPPVDESGPTDAMLAFAFNRALAMGANIMQVHALTPAIEAACRRLGLRSRMSKSIYIALNGMDAGIRKLVSDPASWWCRAFNENQFEEIFLGKAIDAHGNSPLC